MNDFAHLATPQNLDAEASILGGLLIQPDAFDKIAGRLAADEFYINANRLIFSAICAMLEDSKPVDIVTVAEHLEAKGQLENVGGLQYLGEMAQNTPSAANIRHYAQIVRNKAVERKLMAASTEIYEIAREPGTTAGKLDRASSLIMAIADQKQTKVARTIGDAMRDAVEHLDKRFHSGGGVHGLASGFADLDSITGGFKPGELIIVAGRPSMGKTAFAMNISEHVAISLDQTSAVFELEMSDISLADRMLASVGRISGDRMRSGKLHDEDWDKLTSAIGKLNRDRIIVDETPAISLLEMRASLRRIKREHGLSLIVVDYLQLMSGPGENRTQQVGAISRGLKAIAKEFQVPVIALSQLSRKIEERANKRPVMSDLRESGDIEQDADLILFVYRDEVYHSDSPDKGTAEIIIGKHRNGPLGDVRLNFRGEYTRFDNLEHGWRPEQREPKNSRRGFD